MLLSELMEHSDSGPLAFGIEVDTDLLTPPDGLVQVGLVYDGTASEPSDIFVDAVIACTLAGIDTIAEIPVEAEVDAQTILTIAGNAGFSLSLLPPEKEEDLSAWCERCAEFAKAYLDTPHFSGHLYPVSGYFGHLVARSVSGVDAHQASDPYTSQRFAQAIPSAWSDAAKSAMAEAWEERAGGAQAFTVLLRSIAAGAVIETMDLIDRLRESDSGTGHTAQSG